MFNNDIEHEDLEEKIQISADIEFSSITEEFAGLNPMDFKIKKVVKKKLVIDHVRIKKSNREIF